MGDALQSPPVDAARAPGAETAARARRSVVNSLLSMIIPVTMLIAFVSTILYGLGHYMTLEARLKTRMEQVAESRARLAGEPLWKMRYDQVGSVADEILKLDTAVTATIHDDTGAVIATAIKPGPLVVDCEVSHPITYRNGLIEVRAGTLKIGYTRAFVWQQLQHELLFPLLLGLATAATGYAALRIATHIHIGKPLKVLTETIVRSRREGHHYRATIESDNEFGELAQAFNELQEANASAVTKLATLASQDALTGLPNRRGLNEKLRQLSQSRGADVPGAARGEMRGSVAVHFIDLDDFKAINDTFGHETGDKFLVHVAEQLRGVIGPDDWIARLGGDEFIVVQRYLASEDEARALAQRLMAALSTPFVIHDKKIAARASIGIALGCSMTGDLMHLPAQADIALYHSKERGTGTISVLNPSLLLAHSRGRELEIALPQAFAERQFEVWYQAQFDARSGTVCGLEALARWRHPVHGYISPVEFVPLVEKTGFSGRLAHVVLEDACIRARQMQRLGYSDFRIAVNLSPSELADTGFVDTLKTLTRAHDVAPTTLEIEITEGTLINSVADTSAVIGALRAMGVSVALDDFGTGYSSLAYLRRFPIDKIKIDKAFVRNIAQDADDEAVVEMIAVLAGKLGFKVVAEGIEVPEQLQALRAIGVDMGQGFLFHRPQPFADLERFLADFATAQAPGLRASA